MTLGNKISALRSAAQISQEDLAEKLGVKLLGQVPLVASICRSGDDGVPVTLQNSVSGRSFINLAEAVVKAVDERNASRPATKRVETH